MFINVSVNFAKQHSQYNVSPPPPPPQQLGIRVSVMRVSEFLFALA